MAKTKHKKAPRFTCQIDGLRLKAKWTLDKATKYKYGPCNKDIRLKISVDKLSADQVDWFLKDKHDHPYQIVLGNPKRFSGPAYLDISIGDGLFIRGVAAGTWKSYVAAR